MLYIQIYGFKAMYGMGFHFNNITYIELKSKLLHLYYYNFTCVSVHDVMSFRTISFSQIHLCAKEDFRVFQPQRFSLLEWVQLCRSLFSDIKCICGLFVNFCSSNHPRIALSQTCYTSFYSLHTNDHMSSFTELNFHLYLPSSNKHVVHVK